MRLSDRFFAAPPAARRAERHGPEGDAAHRAVGSAAPRPGSGSVALPHPRPGPDRWSRRPAVPRGPLR